jgi:hypothetical protein
MSGPLSLPWKGGKRSICSVNLGMLLSNRFCQ